MKVCVRRVACSLIPVTQSTNCPASCSLVLNLGSRYLTILCHIWPAIAGTGVGKMDGCIDKQMNRRSNREANEKVLIRGWFVAERNHRVCKQNVSVYMAG